MNTASPFEMPAAVTVDTNLTELCRIRPNGHARVLSLELENTGGTTTSGFTVQLKQHKNGTAFTFLADADFDGAANVSLRFCTTIGPHELPGGSKAQFAIDVAAADEVILLAKVAAGSTTLKMRGTEMQG